MYKNFIMNLIIKKLIFETHITNNYYNNIIYEQK